MSNPIDQFLANWKKSAKEFYISEVAEYKSLRKNYMDLIEKYKLHTIRRNQELPEDFVKAKTDLKKFADNRAKSSYSIIQRGIYADNPNNPSETLESFLEKLLDKEVQIKKASLIKKIESKAGEIIDAKNLHIGVDGNINGTVIGKIKSVYVETIYAGGYNIQCLHYRILVK